MTTAPVLVCFNTALPAEIHQDAREYAIGTVILQRDDQNREGVLAYGRCRLLKAECSYSTTERESLAIV